MDNQQLMKNLNIIQERRTGLLMRKNIEYAPYDKDMLSAFKRMAKMDPHDSNITPEYILWTLAKKHILSISDTVYEIQRCGIYPPMEAIEEKLDDLRNYCDLLELLLIERAQNDWPADEKPIEVECVERCDTAEDKEQKGKMEVPKWLL